MERVSEAGAPACRILQAVTVFGERRERWPARDLEHILRGISPEDTAGIIARLAQVTSTAFLLVGARHLRDGWYLVNPESLADLLRVTDPGRPVFVVKRRDGRIELTPISEEVTSSVRVPPPVSDDADDPEAAPPLAV